ncbi:unnamed protein product, partial [Plutella xylostella]
MHSVRPLDVGLLQPFPRLSVSSRSHPQGTGYLFYVVIPSLVRSSFFSFLSRP